MTRLQFDVVVAAEEEVVRDRFQAASRDPREFVAWFTTADDVEAQVTRRVDSWQITVDGPQFRAAGETRVLPHVPGSTIAVDLVVKGRGFLMSAAVALAAGRIENETVEKLHAEFGRV